MSQRDGNISGNHKEKETRQKIHTALAEICKDKQYLNSEECNRFFAKHKLHFCKAQVILFNLENNIKIYFIHASFYYTNHRQTPDLLIIKEDKISSPMYAFIENACQGKSGTKLPAQAPKASIQSELIRNAKISTEFCASYLNCLDSPTNGSFIGTSDDVTITNDFECDEKARNLFINNSLEKQMYELNELRFCKDRKLFKNNTSALITRIFDFFAIKGK